MAKEAFVIDWYPRGRTLALIEKCEEIINSYSDIGSLTLRQLYYQLVANNIVVNTERSYKNVGNLLSKARLAGLIDWDAIEDRGRQPHQAADWKSIQDRVDSALATYRLPRWVGQKYYVELWVEKDALSSVLWPLASEFHITLMVNKGYSSQSAMYSAAQRILENDKDTVVFYLGDHDPSGEDMVRDIRERLEMFTKDNVSLEVNKLALTTAQVRQYRPPPNPAKLTDTRAAAYIAKHGRSSWELDALNPRLLQQIVRNALSAVVDKPKMNAIIKRENSDKEKLRKAVANL